MRYIKQLVLRTLSRFDYQVIKVPRGDSILATLTDKNVALPSTANLVAVLPDIIRELQPKDQPRLGGYQLEMATYDLKTVMGDVEPDFFPIFERCCKYSMTSWQRLYNLHAAVRYAVRTNIQGDFVECGVWRGGSMMMVAHTLLALGCTDKRLFLFDTFEGLPKPDKSLDVDVWGHNAAEGWEMHRKTDQSSDWAFASLEEVRANMESTGYPMDKVFFIKGMVEDNLPAKAPDAIAMLRLDTDWYQSTKHEMEVLYPRLSRNGVLILDDYGHFKGARQAVDEYFALRQDTTPLIVRVDYAGRLAIKIA